MPVLSTVYAENRKEPYGIKSYIFLCINNQKGHLLLYNYVTHKTHTHTKEGVLNEKLAMTQEKLQLLWGLYCIVLSLLTMDLK